MDLNQRKLTKSEWDTIEVSVSHTEIDVLQLITRGYHDTNIRNNNTQTLYSYLKVEVNPQMDTYLFNFYFGEKIAKLAKKHKLNALDLDLKTNIAIKKADKYRLDNNSNVNSVSDKVFEFTLVSHVENLVTLQSSNDVKWLYHYFTLYKLIRYNIDRVNEHVRTIVVNILAHFAPNVSLNSIINNSYDYIEKNVDLLKYGDMTLYDHQKEIFGIMKTKTPKLVLYIAPTGTGKTLTPLGISEAHKIIFVCAARHVGLALARSGLSIKKKIAFAFGCQSPSDVKLHYSAATDYTVDKRSGEIRKVDNSNGSKVEIIICDIKSYLHAMHYMLAHFNEDNIVTYWDEPTITLDYESHEFHEIIQQNWSENQISKMVLSSATLPKIDEISVTINDFMAKFPNAEIVNIVSHDCRKSIPLIDRDGYVVMPHYLSSEYQEISRIVKHCNNNLTLLRYFDMRETSQFINYLEMTNLLSEELRIIRNFNSLEDVNMKSIKLHYLKVLGGLSAEIWHNIFTACRVTRQRRIVPNDTIDVAGNKIMRSESVGGGKALSGAPLMRMVSQQVTPTVTVNSAPHQSGQCAIYVTTKDAYTLTDGPTIFLSNNVEKLAQFYIKQSNIPAKVMDDIVEKIEKNNIINEKIEELEKQIENETEKQTTKSDATNNGQQKKPEKDMSKDKTVSKLNEQITMLRSMVKSVSLNDMFVPNKVPHLKKWAEGIYTPNAFTSDIDEETVISIMMLKDVQNSWKVLLLLGIGVFTQHRSIAYTEIMKRLADKQKLYMIIADSDYIYGTNYQFCHGYLSKDMKLTQEKIIQSLGRIGRNNIQQEYSVRFRDDEQIVTLFRTFRPEEKPEVVNMCRLFVTRLE